MTQSSTVNSFPPLNLLTLLIYTKCGALTFYRSDTECILGCAGTGKEEMKCSSVVNDIFSSHSSFMLSLILQACKTFCLML